MSRVRASRVRALELLGRAGKLVEPVIMENSLIDGALPRIGHWACLDFARAWPDPGPSPAGNAGYYLLVPCSRRACDGAFHRVYPRAAALMGVVVEGVGKDSAEPPSSELISAYGNAWLWIYAEYDEADE